MEAGLAHQNQVTLQPSQKDLWNATSTDTEWLVNPAPVKSMESHETLWRYMNLSTFLLLMDGKAWFPSVESLRAGDPLEGALGKNFHTELWGAIQGTGEIEQVHEWTRNSLPDFMREMLDLSSGDAAFQSQVLGEAYADEVAARMAVWCWHKSYRESAAMWSTYGNKGVAVKTTRECLEAALPSLKNSHIQDITYVDRMSCDYDGLMGLVSENPELLLRPDFLKSVEYEHEKEVRVISVCQKGDKGLMIEGIKAEFMIHEVVISPLLPDAEFMSIQNLVVKSYPSLKIRKSELSHESYEENSFNECSLNGLNELPDFIRNAAF
jgi:hypothetical protein